MNVGIITSYIIAGIILLSIGVMNIRVSNSNAELTMTQITRERVSAIADMLYDDIPNLGYNLNNTTNDIIVAADSFKIQFYRKIDRFDTGDPELITWEFTETPVTSTKNPDDKILIRVVDSDTTQINLGVVNFRLWYFDEHGLSLKPEDNEHLPTPVTSSKLGDIKQIYVALELQSTEKIMSGGDGRYIRSVWEKRFSPGNIE